MTNGRIRNTFSLSSGLELYVSDDNFVYSSPNLHPKSLLGKFSGYLRSNRPINGEYGKLGLLYNVELSEIEEIISQERCYGDRIVIEPDTSDGAFQKRHTVILSPPIVS